MGSIQRKLDSQAGITALFALVVFAIAAMVSFVIVTAALNNVSRVDEQREQERDLLATNSAAALLRETFGGMTVAITQIYDADGVTEREDQRAYTVEPGALEPFGKTLAAEMLKDRFSILYFTLSVSGYNAMDRNVTVDCDGDRVEMRVSSDAEGTKAPPVTVVFDGADMQELSMIPTYRYEYDAEGHLIDVSIDYWTKISQVTLPEEQIHAEVE